MNTKKVIILTGDPYPNGMAATNRIKCYARAIFEGGLHCEVLIYRRTEVFGRPALNMKGYGQYSGVPYRYISGTPQRGRNVVFRQINDRIDIWRTKKYLKKYLNKEDVLFLYMGRPIGLVLSFMSIAQKKGAYCVRDLCELPYGTGAETGKSIRLRKYTLENQFPKLDGIISISDALLDLARTYTLPSCKLIKVPIMVEYEHYSIVNKPVSPVIPYIFHAGTLLQQKDGIIGMIEAFGKAKQRLDKPIKYILTGSIDSSSHPEVLRQIISRYKIEDFIEFVGYLNRDKIKEYLTHASVVISNRPRSKQDYYGFSTKIGEYLASATPLLMTNWGEAVKWLENGRSAYIINPDDTDALADAIVYLFSHPEESRKVGISGQEVCRKCFNYKNWSNQLVEFLYQIGQ